MVSVVCAPGESVGWNVGELGSQAKSGRRCLWSAPPSSATPESRGHSLHAAQATTVWNGYESCVR